MARPLRVGIELPEVEREVRWPEYVAMARAAEEVGFDSIWMCDHLLYRDDGRPECGPWEAWTSRRPPLMLGSTGERMLGIALP
jgi:alkanesulfonate monooxygenase SsuD/methylene tetrahydromethanopterin reductase-like flavin-dependent oxidoreductase (luciferase family)